MYKTIIASIDFLPEADVVTTKASAIAKNVGAELHLLHVLEDPIPLYDSYSLPSLPVIEIDTIQSELGAKLATFGSKYGIDATHCHIRLGTVSRTIVQTAEELNADLIIAGSHGRHGLSLMLMGSTCDSVLHHANVDFLAVRVED